MQTVRGDGVAGIKRRRRNLSSDGVRKLTTTSGYMSRVSVLKHAKHSKEGIITKTSIMLGLGETKDELKEAMDDLRTIDVDIFTLDQYLELRLVDGECVATKVDGERSDTNVAIRFIYTVSSQIGDEDTMTCWITAGESDPYLGGATR
ncbi:lipoyl synthase, chloroplastic [Tanacetum coccineum]